MEVEAIIALIQLLTAFMKANGLSDEDIDVVFEEGRIAKEARPSEKLPHA